MTHFCPEAQRSNSNQARAFFCPGDYVPLSDWLSLLLSILMHSPAIDHQSGATGDHGTSYHTANRQLAGRSYLDGVLPLTILRDSINIPLLLACLWLMGIGLGLSSASLQTSVLESVKLQQAGLATGISSTSRYLGSILGSSILAQILGLAPIEVANFRIVFLVVTSAACIALLMSLGIRNEVGKHSFKKPALDLSFENKGADQEVN